MKQVDWPREKYWKHVYPRSHKLRRARQLGFAYPRESEFAMAERETLKLLFVCTMNQWRSPTAERMYAERAFVEARSRGTSDKAAKTVKKADLQWADVILVMEHKHRERLMIDFSWELRFKELHVLNIPDDYKFMAPELILEIQATVEPILAGKRGS